MNYINSVADISLCGTYRYALLREWEKDPERSLVVVGLNPSTADAEQDDPTIRRCVNFAKREGCGQLVMLNLFALRSTDPRALLRHHDPFGPRNDATHDAWLCGSPWCVSVAAWGAHPMAYGPGVELLARFPFLRCFGVTKGGSPRHPLYLPASAPLVPLKHNP